MEERPYTGNIYPLDMSYNNKAFLEDPVSKVCLFYGNIFTRGVINLHGLSQEN